MIAGITTFRSFTKNCAPPFESWMYDPVSPESNFLSPEKLEETLKLALEIGDGYILFWNYRANWWLDSADAQPADGAPMAPRSRWVPRAYLRQMFGPGVDEAIERYTNPDRELLDVLQLFRRSNRIIFRYEVEKGPKVYEATLRGRKITMYNDTVIAFGQDGKEIFRTTVEEPVHVRPPVHANSI